jgi:3-hydroxyisobutyrate dehydrogenase
MATRLLEWPGGLVVFDVSPGASEPLGARGAEVAGSAAEVGARADLTCVMVNTEDQVRQVLAGPDGILEGVSRRHQQAAPVVAVHSTISPAGAARLGTLAAAGGVTLMDVPVSGGAVGAHGGSLALLVGGETEAFERCREPLGLMGSMVLHFGALGSGTEAKLARNLITFASFAAVGEASRIADSAGIDLVALGEVVRHSDSVTGGPGAIMLRDTAARMPPEDPLRAIFEHSASLGTKDLELVRDLATSLGVDSPVAELASAWLRSALGLAEPPRIEER